MICKQEQVNIEQKAITLLCDLLDNDIRSCLNALQLLAKQYYTNRITVDMLKTAYIGQKDQKKHNYDLWRIIFNNYQNKKEKLLASSIRQRINDENGVELYSPTSIKLKTDNNKRKISSKNAAKKKKKKKICYLLHLYVN